MYYETSKMSSLLLRLIRVSKMLEAGRDVFFHTQKLLIFCTDYFPESYCPLSFPYLFTPSLSISQYVFLTPFPFSFSPPGDKSSGREISNLAMTLWWMTLAIIFSKEYGACFMYFLNATFSVSYPTLKEKAVDFSAFTPKIEVAFPNSLWFLMIIC